MLAFQREAEAILKAGGYEFSRKSSNSGHPIWKHPDPSLPVIKLPGTPRDPDHALIRLRRAVRVGSTPHIPQGLESDMPKSKHVPHPEKPMSEQLVHMAPAGLHKRVTAARLHPDRRPAYAKSDLVTAWLRKCLTSKGAILNKDLTAAADELLLGASAISAARQAVGAVSYKTADNQGPKAPVWTDFQPRVPEDALIIGNYGKGFQRRKPPVNPVTITTMPTDPDEERGRRLDQGGLTEEQRLAAEEQMRRSSELADQEAAEIRQRLAAANEPVGVQLPGESGNGNGKAKTGMELAMELLVQEALAATHALTDDDIAMLRGTQENLKRIKSDLDGMAAGIAGVLRRVDQRQAATAT